MSIELVESILSGDYVASNAILAERIDVIREQKLYEVKRMMQTEVVKPLGTKDADGNPQYSGANDKNDWAKYRKQTKRKNEPLNRNAPKPLGDGGKLSKADIEHRRKEGYVQAYPAIRGMKFIKAVHKYMSTGKIDEDAGKPGRFQQMNTPPGGFNFGNGKTSMGGSATGSFGGQSAPSPSSSPMDMSKLKRIPQKSAMDMSKLSTKQQPNAEMDDVDRYFAKKKKAETRSSRTRNSIGNSVRQAVYGKYGNGKTASRLNAVRKVGRLLGRTAGGQLVGAAMGKVGGGFADIGSQLEE